MNKLENDVQTIAAVGPWYLVCLLRDLGDELGCMELGCMELVEQLVEECAEIVPREDGETEPPSSPVVN